MKACYNNSELHLMLFARIEIEDKTTCTLETASFHLDFNEVKQTLTVSITGRVLSADEVRWL